MRNAVIAAAGRSAAGTGLSADQLARASLYPVHAEALEADSEFSAAINLLQALQAVRLEIAGHAGAISEAVRAAAAEHRYVPWVASTPYLDRLRNDGVTWPTSAAGVWAGFEELDPPVQGNSDTGHQQIGNLTIAPQTPLEITLAIHDGSFFTNEALTATLDVAEQKGSALNFSFLLSGTRGNDGRVHSAWNHLESFLELVFARRKFPPSKVRMQAILDGRDCPARASIEAIDGVGDYLAQLEKLLARYDATDSLAWVIGRNIAMDRDYREPSTRTDYELLVSGKGRAVRGFAGVRAAVEETHQAGKGDGDLPPLVVADRQGRVRQIQSGQAFINLHFRSDRQRARTGALLGARAFLKETAAAHGKEWTLDWLDDGLKLSLCTLSEYHPVFEQLGARVAYPNRSHADNFLALWPGLCPGDRYLLVGESVKSAHVGYFVRGRRESPAGDVEDREIIPSCGEAEGVRSDSDFYRTPAMRNPEVGAAIRKGLATGHRLIVANLSNCDMIGHLLPQRYEAARKALEALNGVLESVVPAALSAGYDVVLTSDHGNIEDDTTAHSTNDVLTTVLSSAAPYRPQPRDRYQARLFDVPATLSRVLGVEEGVRAHLKGAASRLEARFVGGPLIGTD